MIPFSVLKTPAVIPAIDLRGGRCVRLVRGRREAEISYDGEPLEVARRWLDCGARCLHVIDLGAAFGEVDSAAEILKIAAAVDVPVQCGGGIRERQLVERYLDGGVSRVLLGTRAFRDPEFLAWAVEAFGEGRVVVALDCDGDRVKIAGWEEDSPLSIAQALEAVKTSGASHVLVTATDRDGTLEGPRLDLVRRILSEEGVQVVAAGGVGGVDDVRRLMELRHPRLEGVVVGRALYEGAIDLEEAVALSRTFQQERRS